MDCIDLVLDQPPLVHPFGSQEGCLLPSLQRSWHFHVGRLEVPAALGLNTDVLVVVVLSLTWSNPRQTVVVTGIQNAIQLLRAHLCGLEPLGVAGPLIVVVQRLVHTPLLALATNRPITHQADHSSPLGRTRWARWSWCSSVRCFPSTAVSAARSRWLSSAPSWR